MEVSLFIQLTPINILFDQLTLRFLIKFFKINLEDIRKETSNSTVDRNTDSQSNSNSILVSQINGENVLNSQTFR